MPIEFLCPQCGSHLRVPFSAAGKKAQCPQCGAITPVPARSEVGAPPRVPPQEPRSEEPVAPPAGENVRPEDNLGKGAFSGGENLGSDQQVFPEAAPSAIPITPVMQSPYPGYPPPGYHPPSTVPPRMEDTGMSVAALVLGLFGLIAWCCPVIGFPVGLLALIFGIIGAGRGGRGMAAAGIVLGVIVLVLSGINAFLGIMFEMAQQIPM